MFSQDNDSRSPLTGEGYAAAVEIIPTRFGVPSLGSFSPLVMVV